MEFLEKLGMALRDFSIYLSLTFRHEMSLLFFFDGFLCLVSSDGLASFWGTSLIVTRCNLSGLNRCFGVVLRGDLLNPFFFDFQEMLLLGDGGFCNNNNNNNNDNNQVFYFIWAPVLL